MALKHRLVSSTMHGPLMMSNAARAFSSHISSRPPCCSGRSIFMLDNCDEAKKKNDDNNIENRNDANVVLTLNGTAAPLQKFLNICCTSCSLFALPVTKIIFFLDMTSAAGTSNSETVIARTRRNTVPVTTVWTTNAVESCRTGGGRTKSNSGEYSQNTERDPAGQSVTLSLDAYRRLSLVVTRDCQASTSVSDGAATPVAQHQLLPSSRRRILGIRTFRNYDRQRCV